MVSLPAVPAAEIEGKAELSTMVPLKPAAKMIRSSPELAEPQSLLAALLAA